MKMILFLITCISLCSCATNTAKTLKKESEQSLNSSINIGATSSCEVLRRLKKPSEKIVYSNGKYAYVYTLIETQSSGFDKLVSWMFPRAGRATIVKSTTKGATFTFENDLLLDYELSMNKKRQESKYRFMDIAYKPEIEDINNITTSDFFDKITLGMKKGTLFRLIGKPKYSSDHNDMERWVYPLSNTENKSDELLMYIVELKDNIVIDRYTGTTQTKKIDLTDEEQRCIVQDSEK